MVSAGFLFEWESRSFDQESPDVDLGTLHTISLMPMVIWNFDSYGSIFPYLSTAIGVNVNTFSEDKNIPDLDFDNTFAWRLAGGVNYPLEMIAKNFMLNGEVAWKRNRGGLGRGNFDASSLNFLVGVRYTF
jgi:opacity protein-like surface antigen